MTRIINLHNYISKLSYPKYFFLFFSINILNIISLIIFLISYSEITGEPPDVKDNYVWKTPFIEFLKLIVIAPLFEIFLFQSIPIALLLINKFLDKNWLIVVFIDTIFFSSLHFSNNWLNGVFALLGGFALAYTYTTFRKENKRAFLITFLLHMSYNTIPFLLYLSEL